MKVHRQAVSPDLNARKLLEVEDIVIVSKIPHEITAGQTDHRRLQGARKPAGAILCMQCGTREARGVG